MVVNLALVAVLSLQLLRSPPGARDRAPFATWGSLALFPVFYLLTTQLDFFVGIAVVMFVMCLLWGERRVHVATAVGVLTSIQAVAERCFGSRGRGVCRLDARANS